MGTIRWEVEGGRKRKSAMDLPEDFSEAFAEEKIVFNLSVNDVVETLEYI
eukprot:SAG31_NODE_38488_length_295_cov_10.096939_1_plen_49_part_10